jgi:hypothetical protein
LEDAVNEGTIEATPEGSVVRHGEMPYRLTLSTRNEDAIIFGDPQTKITVHRKLYRTSHLLVRDTGPQGWRWDHHRAYIEPHLTPAAERDLRQYLEELAPLVAARHPGEFGPLVRELATMQSMRTAARLEELEIEMARVERFLKVADRVRRGDFRTGLRDVETYIVQWTAPRSLDVDPALRRIAHVYMELFEVHTERLIAVGVDATRHGVPGGGGLFWVPIEEVIKGADESGRQ